MLFTKKHQQRLAEYYNNKEFTVERPRWIDRILRIAAHGRPESVLDYGAGVVQALTRWTDLPVTNYDPLYTPKATARSLKKFDLVVVNHVLEHVEPECLDDVLTHIGMLTKGAAYIAIGLGPRVTTDLAGPVTWKTDPERTSTWWHMKIHDTLGQVARIETGDDEVAFIWVKGDA